MATFINIICAIIGIVIVGAFPIRLFALIYAFIKEKDEGVKMFCLCVLGGMPMAVPVIDGNMK